MTRIEKIENKVAVGVFGTLCCGALVGVMCGATHQLFMAALCGAMVWALVAETKEKKTVK